MRTPLARARDDALLRTQEVHNYRNYDNRDNNRPPSRARATTAPLYVAAKVNVPVAYGGE